MVLIFISPKDKPKNSITERKDTLERIRVLSHGFVSYSKMTSISPGGTSTDLKIWLVWYIGVSLPFTVAFQPGL